MVPTPCGDGFSSGALVVSHESSTQLIVLNPHRASPSPSYSPSIFSIRFPLPPIFLPVFTEYHLIASYSMKLLGGFHFFGSTLEHKSFLHLLNWVFLPFMALAMRTVMTFGFSYLIAILIPGTPCGCFVCEALFLLRKGTFSTLECPSSLVAKPSISSRLTLHILRILSSLPIPFLAFCTDHFPTPIFLSFRFSLAFSQFCPSTVNPPSQLLLNTRMLRDSLESVGSAPRFPPHLLFFFFFSAGMLSLRGGFPSFCQRAFQPALCLTLMSPSCPATLPTPPLGDPLYGFSFVLPMLFCAPLDFSCVQFEPRCLIRCFTPLDVR